MINYIALMMRGKMININDTTLKQTVNCVKRYDVFSDRLNSWFFFLFSSF